MPNEKTYLRNVYEEILDYSKNVGWNGVRPLEEIDEESIVELVKGIIDEIRKYRKDLEESSLIIDANLEEISNTYDLLSTLLEITDVLLKNVNPFEIAMEIVKVIDRNIQAEELSLFLFDEDENLKIFSNSNAKRSIEFFNSYILGSRSVVMNDQIPMIVIPVEGERFNGAFVGIGKKNAAFFTAADRKLVEAASKQLKLSISNYSYFKKEVKRATLEREISIAREIQKGFFPNRFPEDFNVAGLSLPAHDVGGDYYDAFKIDGKLFLTIADVSGKGIGAALMMSMFRSYLKSVSRTSKCLHEIAISLNHLMCTELSEDRFVTAVIGVLDPVNNTFEYVNAGHDPIIILKKDQIEFLESDYPPFGIFECEDFYVSQQIRMAGEDSIVLYTDGLPEARDLSGNEYGLDRMEEVLKGCHGENPSQMLECLMNDIKNFAKDTEQHDDMTVIISKL